jgi:glycerol-3-phosphate dehydrogenase (NAD(P)+)
MEIAVLGAGSWGTALAAFMAQLGHQTRLWGRDPEHIQLLAREHENRRYLPGVKLPESLTLSPHLAGSVIDAELVVLATPTASIRQLAGQVAAACPRDAIMLCASKGLEKASRKTLDQVLEEAVPGRPVAMFSGPTFAAEVARGLPAAAVVACRQTAAASRVQKALASDNFRVYTTDDVTGVAVGGALKNVVAIAAGVSDGLGFGHNTRAALITRGLNEMGRMATRLGANPLTLAGLAGLGDLVLTCTGELSRNRRVGLALAADEPLPSILERLGHVAEGVYTARIAAELADELDIDMPITHAVASVLAGEDTPRNVVAELLAREARPERG